MKIIIAPDSFKDSLSAIGVADAIALGLAEVWPDAQLVKCPMADGGEGTVEAILAACDGELRRTQVQGPSGVTAQASWGWLPQSHMRACSPWRLNLKSKPANGHGCCLGLRLKKLWEPENSRRLIR